MRYHLLVYRPPAGVLTVAAVAFLGRRRIGSERGG